MSERKYRPPNRWGCKPDGDVCMQHHIPLLCRHGCEKAAQHRCKEIEREQGVGAEVGSYESQQERSITKEK